MGIIRFDIRPNFRGETVMLLSVDSDGLKLFEEKVRSLDASKTVRFSLCNQDHTIKIAAEHTTIVKNDNSVAWILTPEKRKEIIDKVEAMEASGHPCHQYIDQLAPHDTLVISLDEYVGETDDREPAPSGRARPAP